MASTIGTGGSTRGGVGTPSTSGGGSHSPRKPGRQASSKGHNHSGGGGGVRSTPETTPADTLDKLLNELVNASAQRVQKTGVGGASVGGGPDGDGWNWNSNKKKASNAETSVMRRFAKLYGRTAGVGGSSETGSGNIQSAFNDDDDEMGGMHDCHGTNSNGGNNKGGLLGHTQFGRDLRLDFDDATSLIYEKSSRYLAKTSGCGLYRDSGMGVGGIGNVATNSVGGSAPVGSTANRSSVSSGSRIDSGKSKGDKNTTSDPSKDASGNTGTSVNPSTYTAPAGGVSLFEHVEAEARDTPNEVFQKYKKDLFGRIQKLIQSPDVAKRLAGVYAIDQLTDSKIGETSNKMNRFAAYLRDVCTRVPCEPVLAQAAARAVGKVARVGGALTAGIADRDVKRSIEWLKEPLDGISGTNPKSNGGNDRRYAAVLILKELAAHAPTVFNVHVSSFIDAIWPALRDTRLFVRQAAVEALRACLVVIERRETRYRVQWYYRLYEETQAGLAVSDDDLQAHGAVAVTSVTTDGQLGKSTGGNTHAAQDVQRVSSQHGSLLAFGELLRHTGEFMLSRYKEVAETVLGLQRSPEQIVRRAVAELCPKLAAFSPKRFTESYLPQTMRLLLFSLKNPEERATGFTAIGDVAAALAAADDGFAKDFETHETGGGRDSPSIARSSSLGGNGFNRDDRIGVSSPLNPGSASVSGRVSESKHKRSGSASFLQRITSQTGLSGLSLSSQPPQSASHSVDTANPASRYRGSRKPLDKYLPEIAFATKELCLSVERNAVALNQSGDTKSGLRPAPTHKEPGAAECFLCVGALAESVGDTWEPFVVELLPFMFAGGLSYQLVAALAAIVSALPSTKRGVEKRVVDAISDVLRVTGSNGYRTGTTTNAIGGGGNRTIDTQSHANHPPVERAELVPDRFGGDGEWGVTSGGGGGVTGSGAGAGGAGSRLASETPADPSSSQNFSSKLRRVFSSGVFKEASGYGGSPPGSPGGAGAGRSGGASASASTALMYKPSSGTSLLLLGGQTTTNASSDFSTSKKTQMTQKSKDLVQKDLTRDLAAVRFQRNRVRLALRTLGTFPFTETERTVSLQFTRKRLIHFLDDDDPATRREAALTCCRLLEVGDDGTDAAAARQNGDGGGGAVQRTLTNGSSSLADSPRNGSSPRSNSLNTQQQQQQPHAKPNSDVSEFLVQKLLQVAVSDLDSGVRKAVLASFCKPSHSVDGFLSQAESLRCLFVALNDENFTVKLIAIRLVGRLAPRNPAYALPALRRHLLQLIAELEHSAESHLREEAARLLATLIRACPRLVAPYIAPVLRALVAKLRVKGSAATSSSHASGAVSSVGNGKHEEKVGRNETDPSTLGGDATTGANDYATNGANNTGEKGGVNDGFGKTGQLGLESNRGGEGAGDALRGTNSGQNSTTNSFVAKTKQTGQAAAQQRVSKSKTFVPAKEKAAVLGALGELAQVGAAGMVPYLSLLLPLILDGIRHVATRDVAVVTLGQLVEATGLAITPFAEDPALLRLLLRAVADESPGATRSQTLRTLGALGALDPLAHKDNEERLHGQGLLSMEGVRGVLKKTGTEGNKNDGDGDGKNGSNAGDMKNDGDKSLFAAETRDDKKPKNDDNAQSGFPDLDSDGRDADPIPVKHLTTASDAFYPTVALNALLRVLRDPSVRTRHYAVTRSVTDIFKSLGRAECVAYLPATVPVVLRVIHECDDSGREFMYGQLVILVNVVNGHVRLYLDDILEVVHLFWRPGPLLKQSLRLLEALSEALHDDFRKYLPTVLPKVVGVLADAERSGEYTAVPATLRALESFGSAADEHLHLALPTLVRLFRPQVAASVPTFVRASVLKSLAQLLPRAQLAGHASAVAHPLIRVLDGEVDALRPYALAALTAMAVALRDDFNLFVPAIQRAMEKRNIRDLLFERAVASCASFTKSTVGGATDEPPVATFDLNSGFANLALRAQKEVDEAYELAGENGRSKTPNTIAGDSLWRGGSGHHGGRGEGSVYGGNRSPDMDGGSSMSYSPLTGQLAGGGQLVTNFSVDESSLRRAWDSSSRSTKEDWLEWMRRLSVEMLKQSPSPALRACLELASTRPRTASDLFCAAFSSCWAALSPKGKDHVVSALESAFGAPTIPPEIVSTLLNLAEFCEHDERPLPVEARTLGAIAERCRAYAKALHYKETEFITNPGGCVEAIIAINNRLQLPEAAMGVLVYAQAHLRLEIKEGWYEKLGQWENALDAHRRKAAGAEAVMREAEGDLLTQNDSRLTQGTEGQQFGNPGSPSRTVQRASRSLSEKDGDELKLDDPSGSVSSVRGGSFGRRRDLLAGGSMGGSIAQGLGSVNPQLTRDSSVAKKRAAARTFEAASETRRDATLGQMRCLAALAEWEALGRLCAREWESSGSGSSGTLPSSEETETPNDSVPADPAVPNNDPSPTPKESSKKDTARRARMAPLATQAAWHLGDWRAMDVYCGAMVPWDFSQNDGESAYKNDAKNSLLRGWGFSEDRGSEFDADGQGGPDNMEFSPDRDRDEMYAEDGMKPGDVEFFKAVLAAKRGNAEEALQRIGNARNALGPELAAMVTENYDRSYGGMVRVQQLTELEEVIEYAELGRVAAAAYVGGGGGNGGGGNDNPPPGQFGATANVNDPRSAVTRQALIRTMWRERIYGVQRKVEVWQALLSVRSLVLPARQETATWLKFASLNRKAGRARQAHRTLLRLLEYDPSRCKPGSAGYGAGSGQPDVMLAYVKHQWALGNKRDAFARLQSLVGELRATSAAASLGTGPAPSPKLVARAFLRLGQWRWALAEDMDDGTLTDVLTAFRAATDACGRWAKAWHHWALFNAAAMEHYSRVAPAAANRHVAPAISGFFRSIALGGADLRKGKSGSLQDILRLLTLWFNHGAAPEVEAALVEGFGHVSIDTWLVVIPQIVARIHSNSAPVRSLIHQLLVRVGKQHPQALLYPLLVACKSQSASRRGAATAVLENLRRHSALLVEQAQVVSLELIRVAILWHEAWHEALEEASQLYFGEQNVDGMLRVLAPLHHIVERLGAETLHEISFTQAYGRELAEANEWCRKYRETGAEEELNQAWDLYYHVFKRINKQLPSLTTLELKYVSPRLLCARRLELCVPGNYAPGVPGGYGGSATIAGFAPTMHVITSKQRPRRLHIHGSDGKDYGYLLKGHEDLRQDERVMQLFGLVNSLLAATSSTSARDLSIARYAVVPLSPNSGLIGWVPNCDTLHALIREHRDSHKVPLNLEQRLMLAMAPDYDHLPLVNKVEVFEHALENTPGNDLARVLWLKSRSSEAWLDRRTTYTRSLATMSMVGYLLGLGDRHPSNLMLDRYSGKLLHIDFGDCFEASMFREKFPERVPFRLTRMLVRAMEVSGIEGNFRSTCEGVVRVLRSNKDSVMAMLEAFVHDPLINWRLLNTTAPGTNANEYTGAGVMAVSAVHTSSNAPTPAPEQQNGSGSNSPERSPRVTPPTSPFEGGDGAGEGGNGGVEGGGDGGDRLDANDKQGSPGQAVEGHLEGDEREVSVRRAPTPPPFDPEADRESTTTPDPELTNPSDSVAYETVYAAASELQRGRVTALDAVEGLNVDANEVLNDRAVSVMRRMSHKLTGRDGAPGSAASAATSANNNKTAHPVSPTQSNKTHEDVENSVPDKVEAQVQRLILAATSHENLCESYIGWCPFW